MKLCMLYFFSDSSNSWTFFLLMKRISYFHIIPEHLGTETFRPKHLDAQEFLEVYKNRLIKQTSCFLMNLLTLLICAIGWEEWRKPWVRIIEHSIYNISLMKLLDRNCNTLWIVYKNRLLVVQNNSHFGLSKFRFHTKLNVIFTFNEQSVHSSSELIHDDNHLVNETCTEKWKDTI